MAPYWIIFATLHIISVLFALIVLYRLYSYIKRYRFDETKYTLLFRFIRLRYITTFYLAVIFLWIGFSYFLILPR